MPVEVQTADVLRVLVQFLRENGLNETAQCLQRESKITLDYIENRTEFERKVKSGCWDEVLDELHLLNLPYDILIQVHEQIFIEMLELNELEAARAILRQGDPLKHLKESNLDEYLKLENILSQTVLNGELAETFIKEKQFRRERIAHVILESVHSVPKSRLTHLIASALKWEEHCGNISANSSFDLLHGTVPSGVEIFHPNTEGLDKFPKNCFNSVKLPSGSFAECLGFSPNGAYFVVGTVDGFMEVWNPLEGTLRTDLPYQQNESDIMSTKGSAISAIAFSLDSELLACGTISGEVLVWKLSTGKQVKAFQKVHQNGITSISFSSDQHSLLTTGFDNNLHILGLKSGRILKEFRGHTSYVNSALWIDESLILSGGHDGSLKVWDVQRVECLFSLIPTGEQALSPPPIRSICKYFTPETKGADDSLYLITTQSSKLHLFSLLKRAFIQTIPASIKAQSHLVFSALRKSFIFSLSNDGQFMAIRSNNTSSIFGNMRVSELEPIGFALHPNFDVLVTFDIGGEIKFWKS